MEINRARATADEHGPVDTIFFGGGTPTAIPATLQAQLLHSVIDSLPVSKDTEITTEANPGTMDVAHLGVLREAGFNRISFGVQSFDAGLLKTMDRIHSADEAVAAVHAARCAGFDNISVDLMFALPGQTKQQWQATLDRAMELGTNHISLYSLIVEPGTGFYTLQQKGKLSLPDEDLAADMFEMAIDSAVRHGYSQYEISNFAQPGRACRHNVHYWRNDPYYGFGCGAVSYLNGQRRMNVKSPTKYRIGINSGDDQAESNEALSASEAMSETMMLGLRLTDEGVNCDAFRRRFGVDPEEPFGREIATHVHAGLLKREDDHLVLTNRGMFLASEVMMSFV